MVNRASKAAISASACEVYIPSWAYDTEATGLIEFPAAPPVIINSILPVMSAIKAGATNVARVFSGEQLIWPWPGGMR